jgi:hypothetical protein
MDTEEGGRWMTFAELAKVRGTSKRAAVMLIRRHGWRRQRNNAGHTIALVPPTWAEPVADNTDRKDDGHGTGHSSAERAPFHVAALAALEDALSALRDGHAAEMSALQEAHAAEVTALRTLADATGSRLVDADARADAATKRADQAEARAEQERLAADWFRAEAEEARGGAEEARATAQEAQNAAEAERDRIAGELARAVEQRTAAQTEARVLREAENTRQQLGRWRRAWRGWRGR